MTAGCHHTCLDFFECVECADKVLQDKMEDGKQEMCLTFSVINLMFFSFDSQLFLTMMTATVP